MNYYCYYLCQIILKCGPLLNTNYIQVFVFSNILHWIEESEYFSITLKSNLAPYCLAQVALDKNVLVFCWSNKDRDIARNGSLGGTAATLTSNLDLTPWFIHPPGLPQTQFSLGNRAGLIMKKNLNVQTLKKYQKQCHQIIFDNTTSS